MMVLCIVTTTAIVIKRRSEPPVCDGFDDLKFSLIRRSVPRFSDGDNGSGLGWF